MLLLPLPVFRSALPSGDETLEIRVNFWFLYSECTTIIKRKRVNNPFETSK